ncbi:hypothetical protein BO71DRAFT_426699 [Aspergillus ellipticus CBS 707.79]|uniref:Uncharacterized protein n=1 Tax=Aspergillus ellipticus CBS 707.79 TaxID=1448320 RepID=A0A319DM72_9EURO|nr:hypothetical protein BO71DRAFT_426699 [Aspergillus ellipticus CBS 707.79]
MSIPASLAASKLRWPEEEEILTAGRVVVLEDDEHKAANALHAFTNGAIHPAAKVQNRQRNTRYYSKLQTQATAYME